MLIVHKNPSYTRIHPLLVNGVLTTSSHTNRDKSSNCKIHVTCVDVRCFLWNVLELNWCCAICILRDLIWQRINYLTLFSLLFDTNCVVITEYWGSNHLHHQWIGRQNMKSKITEWWGRRMPVLGWQRGPPPSAICPTIWLAERCLPRLVCRHFFYSCVCARPLSSSESLFPPLQTRLLC